MNWSQRYAMAQDDTIQTLVPKIRQNAAKFKVGDGPLEWIKKYDSTIASQGENINHQALSRLCRENADGATNQALRVHKKFWGTHALWKQLGAHHSYLYMNPDKRHTYTPGAQ